MASVARELNHAMDSSTEPHLEFGVARNDQRFQGTALGVPTILRLFFVRNGIPATLLHEFQLRMAIRSSRAANKQQSKCQVHRVSQSPANFVRIMKKVKPKIAFAVDVVNETGANARKHRDHEKWIFAESFGNFEALKAMTSTAGRAAQR